MDCESTKRSMPRIVVIGSCSVDFTTYTSRFPVPGETISGTKFSTSFGGKGANQCVAAAKLGGNCFMICRLGDDHWGKQYKDHLAELGVDVSCAFITPNITTGVAQISVADNGENQIIVVPGANNCLNRSDIEKCKDMIEKADILIGQLETPFECTLQAFKMNKGLKIFNAAPGRSRTEIQEILPYCSILCVNESEASILTDITVDISNVAIALNKLLDMGCETVIITIGEKGAVYLNKHDKQPIHVPCQPVKAVDTTGAGDAFVGALAAFSVQHKDRPLHQIIGAACQVASHSVTTEGTQTSYPTSCTIALNEQYECTKL